jgi:hypothetical protein
MKSSRPVRPLYRIIGTGWRSGGGLESVGVWRYELGGYPVIKKWLGYRDRGRRPGQPLSVQEVAHLRGMAQRLAAVLRLHATRDSLYERVCQDCFLAEGLGI